MSRNANVTILNNDGTVEDSFVEVGGDFTNLGSILHHYYQDEAKARRLISLGWIVHVGMTTQASPLVQRFGGEWYENKDLMAVLGQKKVLTSLGGGISDIRKNDAMVKNGMTDKQARIADQLYQSVGIMESQYTLANYRDGIVDIQPEPHQSSLGSLPSNDYEYIYDPKRPTNDKWLCNHVAADDQYMSYSDFPDNNIAWHRLSDLLRFKTDDKK